MINVRPAALACVLVAQSPQASAAQSAAYRWSGGDTVRFRDVATVQLTSERGVTVRTSVRATVALATLAGDTARAWYDSLALTSESPDRVERPDTDFLLRRPFGLRVVARGVENILSGPDPMLGSWDPRLDLYDLLPRLPDRPVSVGDRWSDTVRWTDSTRARRVLAHAIGSYRVERDTVVGGVGAIVVALERRIRIEQYRQGAQGSADLELSGTERGRFVFAPQTGSVLARERQAELRGRLTLRRGRDRVSTGQWWRYRRTLTALR